MSANDVADVVPLLIIVAPLLIAMIASMKPERRRPHRLSSGERAPLNIGSDAPGHKDPPQNQ